MVVLAILQAAAQRQQRGLPLPIDPRLLTDFRGEAWLVWGAWLVWCAFRGDLLVWTAWLVGCLAGGGGRLLWGAWLVGGEAQLS